MRLFTIFKALRHTTQRSVDAVYKTTGYNIVIKKFVPTPGAQWGGKDVEFFYRHEPTWKEANRRTRALQRQGIRAEFRKVVVKDSSEVLA